jgi:hypothetical protein
MPIPLPNLDDRSYTELTAEARALIPHLHPAWTDHNPSDPGIVLVELLAWLTEMLLFQVNEVPEASTETFLQLLNGPDWARAEGTSLDEAVATTMRGLRERYRVVTVDDLEHLALHVWPASPEAAALGDGARLARVRGVPRRNLAATDAAVLAAPAPAHLSLVVVPAPAGPGDVYPQPTPVLLRALAAFLAPRRTLTTRLHVVGPRYVDVGVAATLALNEDAPPDAAFEAVHGALAALFDPLTGGPGGPGGGGWPFGRDVYASEVYAVLEQVPLVNYVEDVRFTGPRLLTDPGGVVIGAALDAHELVRLGRLDLVAYDADGKRYTPSAGGGAS